MDIPFIFLENYFSVSAGECSHRALGMQASKLLLTCFSSSFEKMQLSRSLPTWFCDVLSYAEDISIASGISHTNIDCNCCHHKFPKVVNISVALTLLSIYYKQK